MRKRSFRYKTLDVSEVEQVNRDTDVLFKYKPESVFHNSGSGFQLKGYQEIEHGIHNISGVVASSVQDTINFSKKYSDIFNIQLQSIGVSFTTNVVSYNASSVTIQIDATASLGSADYSLFWLVIGSLE